LYKDNWTHVDDDLPKQYDHYQVCFYNKHIRLWVVRGCWFNVEHGTFQGGGQLFPATHWQNLAAPPRYTRI